MGSVIAEKVEKAARALCLAIARRREGRMISGDSATFEIYWAKWQDEFRSDAAEIISAIEDGST